MAANVTWHMLLVGGAGEDNLFCLGSSMQFTETGAFVKILNFIEVPITCILVIVQVCFLL